MSLILRNSSKDGPKIRLVGPFPDTERRSTNEGPETRRELDNLIRSAMLDRRFDTVDEVRGAASVLVDAFRRGGIQEAEVRFREITASPNLSSPADATSL